MFERSIRQVQDHFAQIGLARVFDGVRRISVVRQESYHDVRTRCIGLRPADVRKPYGAFNRRPYLLIHELGHAFAELWMSGAERRRLIPLFGDYDAPYRRAKRPRHADPDHVSRYSMTHPAEDFAESFAVCIWRDRDPAAVSRLLRGKSKLCARKMAAIRRLIRARARAPRAAKQEREVG
jgi:hypothetical protein